MFEPPRSPRPPAYSNPSFPDCASSSPAAPLKAKKPLCLKPGRACSPQTPSWPSSSPRATRSVSPPWPRCFKTPVLNSSSGQAGTRFRRMRSSQSTPARLSCSTRSANSPPSTLWPQSPLWAAALCRQAAVTIHLSLRSSASPSSWVPTLPTSAPSQTICWPVRHFASQPLKIWPQRSSICSATPLR